jgi:hypothetical protein
VAVFVRGLQKKKQHQWTDQLSTEIEKQGEVLFFKNYLSDDGHWQLIRHKE